MIINSDSFKQRRSCWITLMCLDRKSNFIVPQVEDNMADRVYTVTLSVFDEQLVFVKFLGVM